MRYLSALFVFCLLFSLSGALFAQNQNQPTYEDPYNSAETQRFIRLLEDGRLQEVKEYLNANTHIISPSCARLSVLYAVRGGNRDIVSLLIEKGADVNAGDSGYTALHEAAKLGHREIADILISKGADVNARTLPLNVPGDLPSSYTPLHLAAENGKVEVVKLLISKKADMNVRDSQGKTPLTYARNKNQREVVEYLISAGAKS